MAQPTELDLFIALSKVLTGEKKIEKTLADQYLQRLKAQYSTQMQEILDTFGTIANDPYVVFEVKRRIVEEKKNQNLPKMAQQIIRIWYTSEFSVPVLDQNGQPVLDQSGKPKENFFSGSQQQYYSGLLWKVIQAHPPTKSTKKYGYWTTKP